MCSSDLKSDFLARMPHDLRTPMNAIIGYTRILLRRAGESLDPRQYRNLENIHTSADHLLGLINDILDLSCIEAGGVGVVGIEVIGVRAENIEAKFTVLSCVGTIGTSPALTSATSSTNWGAGVSMVCSTVPTTLARPAPLLSPGIRCGFLPRPPGVPHGGHFLILRPRCRGRTVGPASWPRL